MSVPAVFRTGTEDHARRAQRVFTLPSRISGSAPSSVLDAAGWISVLWVAAALLGIGMFSGGTTSLVEAVFLLYGTGASLAVLGWLAYRGLSRRVRRRAAGDAGPAGAREILAAAASAREEFLQALFPAGATGTAEVLQATAPARAAAAAAPRTELLTQLPSGQAPVNRLPSARAKSPIRKNARRKSAARPAGRPAARASTARRGAGRQAA